jgi:hypothetical protein
MAKWFYYNESNEKIEVTGGQLKGLAKAGMITPDTIVETEEGKTAPVRRHVYFFHPSFLAGFRGSWQHFSRTSRNVRSP